MLFEKLSLAGVVRVRIEPIGDERGFFARTYCRDEFLKNGLAPDVVQSSVSFNFRRGTVRGLHMQWPPSVECKLIRCIQGEILDVLLDLRPGSQTYLQHLTLNLSEAGRDAVFVPAGIAHGFQTLTDGVEVLYQMSDAYAQELATGVRWDDPAFDIRWPLPVSAISIADAGRPAFDRQSFEEELEGRRRAANSGLKRH
jgi:dTDP-4-dehydrorhamnose 3,5-epimerase